MVARIDRRQQEFGTDFFFFCTRVTHMPMIQSIYIYIGITFHVKIIKLVIFNYSPFSM